MENEAINIKKTALNKMHHALGAKMVDFAGYEMPVQYTGVNQEHDAVRNGVGVFDVSHMGEFFIKGPEALQLIQKITSNDASKLVAGNVQYTCLPNKNGGIVDDLLLYKVGENEFFLVVNASNIQKDLDWINSQNVFDAKIKNVSPNLSLLAIQGPKALQSLQKLTYIDLKSIDYYTFKLGEFADIPNVLLSATGYTGAGGFEIYVENRYAEKLWNAIFKAGSDVNIQPIGLAARDTLRLEMGFCLYGNDIDDTTSPIEAGLGWITKFSKDFIHSEFHKTLKENGVTKQLVGFEMLDKGIPRHGYEIWDKNMQVIGTVTSGTMSPTLKKGIGMGYVSIGNAQLSAEIFIGIRGKSIKAIIVKTPFIQPN